MKDPDKQEVGILGLVLISMAAGILVGLWLFNTMSPPHHKPSTAGMEANQP